MCRCHSMSCVGCSHGLDRRGFLKGCGAAAASGLLTPALGMAEEPKAAQKARVALVFLANSADREIWPYPGYDCAAREQEILKLLKDGCPGVDFVPVVVAHPGDVQKAVALNADVDGYLVYVVTLNWNLQGVMHAIGKLGRPMLVADEYLGGSGSFLCASSRMRRQNIPACAVASTRPEDLVAVARLFGDAKKSGMSPEAFAERADEVYRRTFVKVGDMKCIEDRVPLTAIGQCVERLKQSRFVIVGAGPPGQVRDFLGAKGIYVGFAELKAVYDKVDRDLAVEWSRHWVQRAEKVVEPTTEWIDRAAAVYLAMLDLMKKHDADTITMNCLGGFSSGQLPAYPCLGFMQLLDDGRQGVCEAMPDDSMGMIMSRILTGRAGYVSDPALDTSKNQIVYSHCMAHTKVFGPQGPSNKFRIRTLHNHDPRGCCAQSFLPEGYMTTSFRTNVGAKKLVIHQARSTGNLDADRGCRTQLLGEVRNDIGKLFRQWDLFGWHRVTVYGDIQEPLVEFAKALGLEVIRET